MMLQATDGIALNLAFTGKGNTAVPEGLVEIVDAGAVGLKVRVHSFVRSLFRSFVRSFVLICLFGVIVYCIV
jgi:hypothetical protein